MTAHALAIKTDGTLWAWGNNGNGSLGLGNTTDRSSPVQVGALTTWLKASNGYSNSFGLLY
jgi:alpha-tubulin suppressor-like RCC1 family protein